ncbi:MAG: NAD(P)/FAD-dependent oxidoreductase [Dehalococcoidia bacterium]|nr:NAD(P)/FAD-dependent oxidoreductase [Dehalococcoidia bacterium]
MEERDIVVIGSGPGGHAAALRASELGASVAIVEADLPGGNCVNFGCLPNTVMLETARARIEAQDLALAGVLSLGEGASFARAEARKNRIVGGISHGIRNQLRGRGIELIEGVARFASPRSVVVSLKQGGAVELSARAFVIATGARPQPPLVPGYSGEVLVMDQALRLPEAPSSALFLGGGPEGLGFALEQAFVLAVFGTAVTVVDESDDPLPGADREMLDYLLQALAAAGVRVILNGTVKEVSGNGAAWEALVAVEGIGDERVAAEVIAAPDCRRPHFEGLGLEEAGVSAAPDGISVDAACRTNVENIFAVGDVTGRPMFSNAAMLQGRVAAENALGLASRVRLGAVPRALHTEPELAWVGLNEAQAREQGLDARTGMADLAANSSAAARGRAEGAVKLLAGPDGEVLGVHVLGPGAGELIGLAAQAIALENTVDELADIAHWHPSLNEALVEAARNLR